MRERRVTRAQLEKVDARVARVAARQFSVVSLAQLHDCGMSDGQVTWRVQSGRLFPYFRGVYALIPQLSMEGLFLAAVIACGPGAVLSHYSAAALRGWVEWDGREPEVTTPTPRYHPGIRTHRSQTVERVVIDGIPATPAARTAIDISATLPERRLRRAINEALNQRQLELRDLVTSGHRGARKLRRVLASAAPTRSELEDVVLAVLADLPKPDVNRQGTRFVPDFRWPEHRVILEADSVRFHDQPLARADDAKRQRVLEREGNTVLRTTWDEATLRPGVLERRVRAALDAATVEFLEYSARNSTLVGQ
jgi:very-short-patch-repair endonuclease